ncbi:ABC transporter permease [Aeromicrobium piscarium]|uniref:Iron ABC transporter permease n=1 Tax=Aeromicrobium piscarium TaxID=2590901 RepID=A0A554RXE0_9ACTN|nr:iron ABC transporter permease [Aeromicrobium piscarium]TSD58735.1 iron ABC transporter permease [Aeromicrobium piscarium]
MQTIDSTELGALARRDERAQRWRAIRTDPWLWGIFLVLTLSVAIFILLPIGAVLKSAVIGPDGFDLSRLGDNLLASHVWRALRNSLLLAVLSATAATAVGFVMAYGVTRTGMKGKRFFHLVALLPIVSPPFVLSLAIILLFGRSGVISSDLLGLSNANVYGLRSLVIIQTLAFSPLAYLNVRDMLQSMDSSLEDASSSMGASQWQTFRRVLLPLAAPALLSSFMLVFVKSLEDFGNPMLIGGDYSTLAVEAYTQITAVYDMQSGAILAVLLLLPSVLAFMIQRYWVGRRSYVTVTGKPGRTEIRLTAAKVTVPLTIVCSAISGVILLFYGTVVAVSFMKIVGVDSLFTLDHYRYIFDRGLSTLQNSVTLAAVATPLVVICGLLISYVLTRRSFPGSAILKWSTLLSFAAPGTIIGIGYILSFNSGPLVLTGTAAIIVGAMVLKNLQVAIEGGNNQLKQIDPAIEEASAVMGASNIRTFRSIVLPLLRPAIFTSAAYAFTRSLTTLSAVIFLISANWNLVTVTILGQVESSRLSVAAAYCVLLIVIVLAALALMQGALALLTRRRDQ